MSECYYILDTTDGTTSFVPIRHEETVSSPTSAITIEHFIPLKRVKVELFSLDGYLLPRVYINEFYCGEHTPVVTNQFYVEITFNDPFTGIIQLYY